MKKLLLILLLLPSTVFAYQTNATSTVLMDTDNNRIIYKDNCNEVRSLASISKIMTAILAIESKQIKNTVKIGQEIEGSYGSGIYIKENEEIKMIDLVYGLLLRSGNDAALAIAFNVAGSLEEFVNLMNNKAQQLKMNNTKFSNPSGLDGTNMIGNYGTACDMAKLMSYCMKNETFRRITNTRTYKAKTNLNFYDWTNKNKLLRTYKYATGGKTGFTDIAKRTLVTTASKRGVNLVAVTLNDGNDFEDHKNMFEEAFKEYKKFDILKKGNVEIIGEKFYKNRSFYLIEDFSYLLRDDEVKDLLIKFKLKELYVYNNNDKVGEATIYLGKDKIHKANIFVKIKKEKINPIELIKRLFKW